MSEYEKDIKLHVAYEIIGKLDEGLQDIWIDKAIEKLESLRFVRKNIPF